MAIKKTKDDMLVEAFDELTERKKAPRTILVNDDQYQRFQEYCREHGVKPANLIDSWISKFLKMKAVD